MIDTPSRKAMHPDTVILRRWRGRDGTVIALFPAQTEVSLSHPEHVNSYEHIGQHGAADYAGVIAQTVPVDGMAPDVIALLAELRRIGYEPVPRQRRWRSHT